MILEATLPSLKPIFSHVAETINNVGWLLKGYPPVIRTRTYSRWASEQYQHGHQWVTENDIVTGNRIRKLVPAYIPFCMKIHHHVVARIRPNGNYVIDQAIIRRYPENYLGDGRCYRRQVIRGETSLGEEGPYKFIFWPNEDPAAQYYEYTAGEILHAMREANKQLKNHGKPNRLKSVQITNVRFIGFLTRLGLFSALQSEKQASRPGNPAFPTGGPHASA